MTRVQVSLVEKFKRLYEAVMNYSFDKQWGDYGIWVTGLCTLNCLHCGVNKGNRVVRAGTKKYMTIDDFTFFKDEIKKYGGTTFGAITGGEPTLVPDLKKILIEALDIFPLRLNLISNLYNKTSVIRDVMETVLAHDIEFTTSLDGFGKTADYLRCGKTVSKTVIKHMKMITEMKRKSGSNSSLGVNTVLSNVNLHQVPKIIKFVNKMGWTLTFQPACVTSNVGYMGVDKIKLTPSKKLDWTIQYMLDHLDQIIASKGYVELIPKFVAGSCPSMCPYTNRMTPYGFDVIYNGDVLLCDKIIGNLYEQGLNEIFTSENLEKIKKKFLKCEGCLIYCLIERVLMTNPLNWRFLPKILKKVRTNWF
jgi:MoaA/NifB/PqqE/SkfB family radical SAM enzyme